MKVTGRAIFKSAIIVLICFTLYACRTVEEVYFNATEPAPVTIPIGIKRVGIINASVISDSSKSRKKIDDVLSAKGPNLDKECSVECIRGLKDAMVQSNLFQSITFLDSVNIENKFPGVFPAPLSWDAVEDICNRNNVDVLFVLELFHTDTRVNLGAAPAGLMNGRIMAVAGSVSLRTTVSTGWRIYDPKNKLILDEFPIAEWLTFGGGGVNPLDIATAIMNHKADVMGVSYHIGQEYEGRILPYTIRVCREFYIRGTINFKIARRMADAGDWNNAADLWNKETANPRPKMMARAYYNMAIISEMNGNIDAAIDWAKKAYETGGRRLALFYLNVLKDRKAENDLLKSQAAGQ